ncbi:MAG: alpha/beta hydrolase [Turneriella sp.]
MQQITLTANGLSHPALKLGDGKRLALLLHGFPDSPRTWSKLMPRLAAQGYTCIAPYMRGYSQKNTPADLLSEKSATVQIADLAADAAAMVEAAGFSQALLVGHDWGAITAYAAANLAPQKFHALVTLSVPHLRIFLGNLWKNPQQFLQSWYILFFQIRLSIPERRVQKDNFAFIEELWRRWSPDLPISNEALAHVKEIFSDPQLLHNALAYYRGMLTPALGELAKWNQSRELSFADVKIPTLTLTGSSDGCIVPEMFEGMHTAIQNEFILRILPTAGHFLTFESDERIATEISRFTENYAEVKHA